MATTRRDQPGDGDGPLRKSDSRGDHAITGVERYIVFQFVRGWTYGSSPPATFTMTSFYQQDDFNYFDE
jgi:hypothetical protein